MVRFKYWKLFLAILYDFNVSIPLWFDSNGSKVTDATIPNLVSIPLWFDSNLRFTASLQ